MTGCETTISQI